MWLFCLYCSSLKRLRFKGEDITVFKTRFTRRACLSPELNSREERSKQYFDTPLDADFRSPLSWEVDSELHNIDEMFGASAAHRTQHQLVQLEQDNTEMVARREKEVGSIVRSIVDLNDVFKDLAHMVVDQVSARHGTTSHDIT